MRYMRWLLQFSRRPLESICAKTRPLALDLIVKMLTFNPLQNITGKKKVFHNCIITLNIAMLIFFLFTKDAIVGDNYCDNTLSCS